MKGLNVRIKCKEMFEKYGEWDKRFSRMSAYINQPKIRTPDKLFPKLKWDKLIVQQLSSLTS